MGYGDLVTISLCFVQQSDDYTSQKFSRNGVQNQVSTVTWSLFFGSQFLSTYHWSLGFRSFVHRCRYDRPQFVEHNRGLHNLPFEICPGSKKLTLEKTEEATNPSNSLAGGSLEFPPWISPAVRFLL